MFERMGEGIRMMLHAYMAAQQVGLADLARLTRLAPVDLANWITSGDWPAWALLRVADGLLMSPLPLFRLAGSSHDLEALASV